MASAKLNPKALGLSLGILGGVVFFLWTLVAAYTGYGLELLELLITIYPGYSVTAAGALIGFIYCFLDGFVGGYLIAYLYNWAGKR